MIKIEMVLNRIVMKIWQRWSHSAVHLSDPMCGCYDCCCPLQSVLWLVSYGAFSVLEKQDLNRESDWNSDQVPAVLP